MIITLKSLIENILSGNYRVLIDGEGRCIKWSHLENLHKLQTETQMHLANKLRKPHINFKRNIMSVRYAGQTLSRSVADSLLFLSSDLKLDEFEGAECCIVCIDRLFDAMNSRHSSQSYSKAVLKESNKEVWMDSFNKATQ